MLCDGKACASHAVDTVLLQMRREGPDQDDRKEEILFGSSGPVLESPSDTKSEHPALIEEVREAEVLSYDRPSSLEMEHFRLVKELRQRGFRCPDGTYFPPNNGPLEWDCRLWRAAKGWSIRQGTEGFVGHTHQGSEPCQRTEAQGYPRMRGCGENIAAGRGDPQGSIEQLQDSNSHCKNMMDPAYNMIGVGYFENPNAKFRHYWTDNLGDWHQGPDQSCIGGSPAPTPRPGCADIDTSNCGVYRAQGLCTVSPNVMAQCRETCNIDGCGTPSPSPGGSCEDSDPNCQLYGSSGYCSADHIKAACRRTCGQCGGAPSPAQPCVDTDGACAFYYRNGYCSTPNVARSCQQTCGFCR